MKRFAIIALLVAGCGGTALAPSLATSGAPATSAPTPTATATAEPAPSVNEAAVRHVVDAIDRLTEIMSNGGGVIEVGDWSKGESDWLRSNGADLPAGQSGAYLNALSAFLTAVQGGTDSTAALADLTSIREQLAGLVGGIATPAPTPEPAGPTQYTVGDAISLTQDGDPWAEITVTHVKQVTRYGSGYLIDRPAKGNVYIQALITYSALADGVDYNPYDWQVFVGGVASDDTTYVSDGPKPELGSGTLPKDRKASGYVVYEVKATGKVLLSYGGRLNSPPVFEVVLRAR